MSQALRWRGSPTIAYGRGAAVADAGVPDAQEQLRLPRRDGTGGRRHLDHPRRRRRVHARHCPDRNLVSHNRGEAWELAQRRSVVDWRGSVHVRAVVDVDDRLKGRRLPPCWLTGSWRSRRGQPQMSSREVPVAHRLAPRSAWPNHSSSRWALRDALRRNCLELAGGTPESRLQLLGVGIDVEPVSELAEVDTRPGHGAEGARPSTPGAGRVARARLGRPTAARPPVLAGTRPPWRRPLRCGGPPAW